MVSMVFMVHPMDRSSFKELLMVSIHECRRSSGTVVALISITAGLNLSFIGSCPVSVPLIFGAGIIRCQVIFCIMLAQNRTSQLCE